MLENRSFDHMLGFLYPNKTGPNGQPFEGLLGNESNKDTSGKPVTVYQINTAEPNAYFMPGADPGEGYANTNSQLFGTGKRAYSAGSYQRRLRHQLRRGHHLGQRSTAPCCRTPTPPHHGHLPAVRAAGPVRAGERLRGMRSLVQLSSD